MVLHSISHALTTLEILNKQRNLQLFTNFTIVVSGKKFFAHQSVVAAHSPVIKRAIVATQKNNECFPTIYLDGVDSECFSILLDFLYTSYLKVNSDNINQLLTIAEYLQIPSICDLCNQYRQSDDINDTNNLNEVAAEIEQPKHSYQQIEVEVTEDFGPIRSCEEGSAILQSEGFIRASKEIEDIPEENKAESHLQPKRGRKPVERFSCPICNKVMTEARLKVHMRSHTKEKPAFCRICNKSFATIYNLKIHEYTHTGEKPYKCSLCPRAYADPSSLSKHKLWHAGVRRQKCDICGRLFSTRSQVAEHMRTHTKERPFPCPKCDKHFAYKCDLARHLRAHNGDLLGPCRYCGRFFTHTGNYKAHLKTHEKKIRGESQPGGLECDKVDDDDDDVRNPLNSAFLLSSSDGEHTVELVGDDNQCRIVKVRDLAELVARGHEIEVVIGNDQLVSQHSPNKSTSDGGMNTEEPQLADVNALKDC